MIVGNRRITDYEITKHANNLMVLAQKSVPSCCRHTAQLENNQLFYLLLRLRNIKSIPFKVKSGILSTLAPSTGQVTGTVESIYDIEDVLLESDTNSIFRSVFGSTPTTLTEGELHAALDAVLRSR